MRDLPMKPGVVRPEKERTGTMTGDMDGCGSTGSGPRRAIGEVGEPYPPAGKRVSKCCRGGDERPRLLSPVGSNPIGSTNLSFQGRFGGLFLLNLTSAQYLCLNQIRRGV